MQIKIEAAQRLQVTAEDAHAKILKTIKAKYPQHADKQIREWIASAEEYGQPLTLEEYEEWLSQE